MYIDGWWGKTVLWSGYVLAKIYIVDKNLTLNWWQNEKAKKGKTILQEKMSYNGKVNNLYRLEKSCIS